MSRLPCTVPSFLISLVSLTLTLTVSLTLTLTVSLTLCLTLTQTDEPSHEGRKVGTSK